MALGRGGSGMGGGATKCPESEGTQMGRDSGAAWVGIMGWGPLF